jgi:uncharacterized damage-inducible protein DinB
MKHLYEYNWQVRDEWFELLESISDEEFIKPRIGGLKSISETLFHIVVVEYYWMSGLLNKLAERFSSEDFKYLGDIKKLSTKLQPTVMEFVSQWDAEMESKVFEAHNPSGNLEQFTYGEVMRHVLIHEIHHVGQLSIWARELDLEPVSANFIRRGLMK